MYVCIVCMYVLYVCMYVCEIHRRTTSHAFTQYAALDVLSPHSCDNSHSIPTMQCTYIRTHLLTVHNSPSIPRTRKYLSGVRSAMIPLQVNKRKQARGNRKQPCLTQYAIEVRIYTLVPNCVHVAKNFIIT